MQIWKKLMIGFSLYVTMAFVVGLFAYIELQAVTKRFAVIKMADDINNAFLEVRRNEKDFSLTKDKGLLQELKKNLGAIISNINKADPMILKGTGGNSLERIRGRVIEYDNLIDISAGNIRDKKTAGQLNLKADEIQSLSAELSKNERNEVTEILGRTGSLLLSAIVIIMVLGTFINIRLARSIAGPLKNLEEITRKIAAGDFSERLNIKGKDEFATLGASFNQMQDRLLDTMKFLELANEKLRENRAKLVETEKLATLGGFSAGIAHEINNPLAIINEKTGLMKDYLNMTGDFPNKEKFLTMLNAIAESVTRCSTITHRILGFARRADAVKEVIELNSLIKEVLGFLEKEIFYKSIRLDLNLKEDIPAINSDRTQLQQVFLNLIKNAVDAVEEGGFIGISTETKNKETVRVIIADKGHGIPREVLKNIFEPFFTTKEKGKGTGLGLSISYGIIKGLGGNILVRSEVNQGTTFTVELPV